jgi:CelD/BcsL family acetyltransferase involved in cellulose biosynthesis
MKRVLIQEGGREEVFSSIKAEWQRLFAASGCSPFLDWEWMFAWYNSFAGNKSPYVLKAFREDKLIGILPMIIEEKKLLGMRFKQLSLMGEGPGGADHLGVISRPEDRSDSLSAIFDYLRDERHFDLIRLENLAEDSDTVVLLKSLGRTKKGPGLRFSESVTDVCPQIDLTGGWEAILHRSKRAANFKRRLRKIEKMNGFEYRSLTSPDETAAAFERFIRLHDKRRAGIGGSELSGHPRLISFQRSLIPGMARAGLIRFDELWVEGECRSSVYGLDDGQTFYYYNSGFDPDYAHQSVGLVLLGLSVKNAAARGCSVYDFLRGGEAYKFDWATRSTNFITVSWNRGTARAVGYEHLGKTWSSIRNVSKSVLPAGISETIAGWRRAWKRNHRLSDR